MRKKQLASIDECERDDIVGAYFDAIQTHISRIWDIIERAPELNIFERLDLLQNAIDDGSIVAEIKELQDKALAKIRLMDPTSRQKWDREMAELSKNHATLVRHATVFWKCANEWFHSGTSVVVVGFTGQQPRLPPEIGEAVETLHQRREILREKVEQLKHEWDLRQERRRPIEWKQDTRELWYGEVVIKQFTHSAVTNQEKVLREFQNRDWVRSIQCPLLTKRQLNETLRELNKSLKKSGIRFRALGNGSVFWSEETPNTTLP